MFNLQRNYTHVTSWQNNAQNSQARLQQYMNHELPDVQNEFRKGRGTRDQIVNFRWITKKASEFQKNLYFCFTDYAKAFDCADNNKLWTILKEMEIPDHLTCLLINLYVGQEATVRTGHGTTDWFQIGKGACHGCILSPCLFNLYAEYIQLSYFKSWKLILWKCCTQNASKFGKLSSGHRTGKGQFSFQSQRKAMTKNAQTIAQLHSSHTLAN